MKRVKAACICQTLHFMLKEDAAHGWAVKQVNQEVKTIKIPWSARTFSIKLWKRAFSPTALLS